MTNDTKLDEILSTVKALADRLTSLDARISHIENSLNVESTQGATSSLIGASTIRTKAKQETSVKDFSELDKHFQETYDILKQQNKAMTATEVAALRQRSRSTISHHLNELNKSGYVEKIQGPEKTRAKEMFFKAVELNLKRGEKK